MNSVFRQVSTERSLSYPDLYRTRVQDILNAGRAGLPFVNEKLRNESRPRRVDALEDFGLMASRDDLIRREALELWGQMRQGPAPDVSGGELLEILCRDLDIQAYDRVQSPFLRPSMILRPEDWPEARKA